MKKYKVSAVIITLAIIAETFYPTGDIVKYWFGYFGAVVGHCIFIWYLYCLYKIISNYCK